MQGITAPVIRIGSGFKVLETATGILDLRFDSPTLLDFHKIVQNMGHLNRRIGRINPLEEIWTEKSALAIPPDQWLKSDDPINLSEIVRETALGIK